MATQYRFKERQAVYRAELREFFAEESNAAKLKRITDLRDQGVYHLLAHFLSNRFEQLVKLRSGATVRLNETYRNAMSNFKKRYFNLLSRQGEGDLVWEGQPNPAFDPGTGAGEPLPRLVALQWLIRMGFDAVFWERFQDVKGDHDAVAAATKKRYTDNHKRKNALERALVEEEVRRERAAEPPRTGRKKKVKFTRVERREIFARIAARKEASKKMRKRDRLAGYRPDQAPRQQRPSVKGCAIIIKK